MDFADWMRRSGKSDATVRHYVGAVYGSLGRIAAGLGRPAIVDQLADEAQALEWCRAVSDTDEFQALNTVGHRMYSSALSAYRQYRAALAAGASAELEDLAQIEIGRAHV